MESKKSIWKGIAIAALIALLIAAAVIVFLMNRPASVFAVDNGADGVVHVTAQNAGADSAGIGYVTLGEGQRIVIESALTDKSSVDVKVRSGDSGEELFGGTFANFDAASFDAPAGEYSILITARQGTTGQLTVRAADRPEEAGIGSENNGEAESGEQLSLWTADAAAKEALVTYVAKITDPDDVDYIPPRDRIAVFDLDGTLFCETDPNYFDYCLLVQRVLEDPDYKERASEFEREVAQKIVEQNETGASFAGLELDHGKAVASAFSGLTIEEFNAYIQEFKNLPAPGYEGMNRGEAFYQPMLQVVDYLQANDFTVYIVSGTDRFIVRGIVDGSPLDIPAGRIIGSDESVVTQNQGETDGLDYVFDENDQLVLGGEFLIKNLKMNKVAVIMQEIGQKPVLSFGNSTGDASMAEYTTSNNPYRSLAFMLCCDDLERENGNMAKAEKMYALCEEFHWVPISMKNDWTTIYGEGVTSK